MLGRLRIRLRLLLLCSGVVGVSTWFVIQSSPIHTGIKFKPIVVDVLQKGKSLATGLEPDQNSPPSSTLDNSPDRTVKIERLSNASLERRQQYYDIIIQHNSTWLLHEWRVAVGSTDDQVTNGLLSRALSYRLQADVNEKAAYLEASAYILDSSIDVASRSELIRTLGRAATAGSLQVLIDVAIAGQGAKDVLPEIYSQITKIGENRWENRFHPELAPIYQQAVVAAAPGSGLAGAAISGLAAVGSRGAVDYLLGDVLQFAKTIDDINKLPTGSNLPFEIKALGKISNPESISLLADGLRDQGIGDLQLNLSGAGLAAIGDARATAALLKWAQNARGDMAPLAKEWFSKTRDTASFELIDKSLQQQIPFVSVKIRSEVQAVLNARNEIIKKMNGG